MKTCPSCQAQVVDEAKFCNKCGFNIKASESQNSFCVECGAKLESGSLFCIECGKKQPENDGLNSFDFSLLQDANEMLIEQSGLSIENGILTGYTGKRTSVFIPNSVEEIFDRAFYNNDFITDVHIDNGASVIGKYAFSNCRCLKKIKISKSVKQIGEYAFYGTRLECLILDEYDKSILISCLTPNGIKYLNAVNDIKSVISEENGCTVINISKLENQAIEYLNECKQKEQEERERQIKEAQRKRELLLADIGKIWTFGSYYQNSDSSKEPLEWIVVDRREGGAMLITKNAIAYKNFNETNTNCYWQNSTLHNWLVNDFFNSAFSNDEKSRMMTLKEASEKTNFNATSYMYLNVTNEKVFLLTKDNAFSYLKTIEQRQCKSTPYAMRSYFKTKSQFASLATDYNKYGACNWWLCGCPHQYGKSSYFADCVKATGDISLGINNGGCPITLESGVRPIIWINV